MGFKGKLSEAKKATINAMWPVFIALLAISLVAGIAFGSRAALRRHDERIASEAVNALIGFSVLSEGKYLESNPQFSLRFSLESPGMGINDKLDIATKALVDKGFVSSMVFEESRQLFGDGTTRLVARAYTGDRGILDNGIAALEELGASDISWSSERLDPELSANAAFAVAYDNALSRAMEAGKVFGNVSSIRLMGIDEQSVSYDPITQTTISNLSVSFGIERAKDN